MKKSGSWTKGTAAFGIFISDLSQAANVAGYQVFRVDFTEHNDHSLVYNIEINRDWKDINAIFAKELNRYA